LRASPVTWSASATPVTLRISGAKGHAVARAMTIAHRRAVDRVRRTVAATFDREHLLRCLDQLSDLQREAITMAFYGGHTHGQVASILDVPLGTVKARIRDALIKLRGCMLSEP
jgi:RNA polymerase sigma-70 factor (ECF subfamily)